MTTAVEPITEHRTHGVTTFSVGDLGPVASYWKQGAWRVRLVISPDEIVWHRCATREAARSRAFMWACELAS